MSANWSDLSLALDRLAGEGTVARFWLRDDDAVSGTADLSRLVRWAAACNTQVLLALVPSKADDSLRAVMAETPQLVGAVHGWAHKNHAPEGEKKQELGAHRPLDQVCAELSSAQQRTLEICGTSALPVLVPPWNRIADEVVDVLAGLGFKGLSTFSDAFATRPISGLQVANSHVDIIDWRGSRGGKAHDALIEEVVGALETRAAAGEPIGILSHHLAHDETAWSFLERLGETVSAHPSACWISPRDLFGA